MSDRKPPRTTLQKLLSRFHFGVTLFAVALSGLAIMLAGVAALRGYADRNIELAAQLGAYGVEPALVFRDPQAAREGIEPLTHLDRKRGVEGKSVSVRVEFGGRRIIKKKKKYKKT